MITRTQSAAHQDRIRGNGGPVEAVSNARPSRRQRVRSIPKWCRAVHRRVALILGWMGLVSAALGQSASFTAEITLIAPQPSCGVSNQYSLDFGTAEKPTSGSGSVTISATTGTRSSSGVTVSGTSSVGQLRVNGSNVSSYSVTRTFPSSLTKTSTKTLSYSGTWAHSTSSSSGYTALTATSYSGTSSGAGSSFTRYFRFGGTVSGIDNNDETGDYDGTISASATCN